MPSPAAVRMCEVDGPDATYIASFVAQNPGTGVALNDILILQNGATKTLRVLQAVVMATIATAAATIEVQLVTRSTAASGGTPSATLAVNQSAADPAASATAKFYTAPPTPGTLVGVQGVQKLFCPLVGALGGQVVFNFGYAAGAKAIVIAKGAGNGFAINLNGLNTANALSVSGYVIWTERDSAVGE